MPLDEDYKSRFLFEISEEQKERSERLLGQYGLRKALFSIILDDVLDMIEKYGPMSIGAIMSRAARPRDIIPSLKIAEDIKDGRS